MQAGATGMRPALTSTPAAMASCPTSFRIGVVTDVAGLRSTVDAAAWQGIDQAVRDLHCAHAELIASLRPSDYRRNLQAAVDRHDDLVVASSFLLTDAAVETAAANPQARVMLVDPIIAPRALPNLMVLSFREDQAAFLAGALAGMMTKTGVVAGVYGPEGATDRANRTGYERGARYVRPEIRVLGAYQPATQGAPYANPTWGAAQARAFSGLGADVIFGAGGTTGEGALLAAAQLGRLCIGAGIEPGADPPIASCLVGGTLKRIDAAVERAALDAAAGRWAGGLHSLGVADGAVGLTSLTDPRLTPEIRQRLQGISDLVTAGSLTTGL